MNRNNILQNSDPVDNLQDLLQISISLQARQVFPNDSLCKIVMKSKRNPEDYVKAYNLCDGEHTMSQIASAINVKPGTLSPILAEWREIGIIYEISKKGGKFYKRLYRLEIPKSIKMEQGKSDDVTDVESAKPEQEPIKEPTQRTGVAEPNV